MLQDGLLTPTTSRVQVDASILAHFAREGVPITPNEIGNTIPIHVDELYAMVNNHAIIMRISVFGAEDVRKREGCWG